MKFGFVSMLVRWFMIMGVLTAIYNPSGRSFVHWAVEGTAPLSLRVAVGSVLLAMLAYCYRLSVRALGPIGLVMLAALLAVTATALVEIGLIQPQGRAALIAYLQAIITTGLTIGVSWSALRTRISGQIDSDDISRRWTP